MTPDMPSFFATVGSTTSSQSAPFGGVKLFSGGTKCAATPSRWLGDVESGVGEVPVLMAGLGRGMPLGVRGFAAIEAVSLPCRRRGMDRARCTAASRSWEERVAARPILTFVVRGAVDVEEEARKCPASGRGMPPPVVALRCAVDGVLVFEPCL